MGISILGLFWVWLLKLNDFWSLAGNAYGPSISPLMLYNILFLKVNDSYWGPTTVSEAMEKETTKRIMHLIDVLDELEEGCVINADDELE